MVSAPDDVNSPRDDDLDDALQALATLEAKPLGEQVQILTDIQGQLTTSLSELDHL